MFKSEQDLFENSFRVFFVNIVNVPGDLFFQLYSFYQGNYLKERLFVLVLEHLIAFDYIWVISSVDNVEFTFTCSYHGFITAFGFFDCKCLQAFNGHFFFFNWLFWEFIWSFVTFEYSCICARAELLTFVVDFFKCSSRIHVFVLFLKQLCIVGQSYLETRYFRSHWLLLRRGYHLLTLFLTFSSFLSLN